MCAICDTYDQHVKTLKEIAVQHPELKDKLQEVIVFLYESQDHYVDAAVEADGD
jgi:hypothetical protein